MLSRITQFFEVEDDAGNKVRSAKFAVDVARSFGGVSSKQAEAEFLATFDEYMKRVGEGENIRVESGRGLANEAASVEW